MRKFSFVITSICVISLVVNIIQFIDRKQNQHYADIQTGYSRLLNNVGNAKSQSTKLNSANITELVKNGSLMDLSIERSIGILIGLQAATGVNFTPVQVALLKCEIPINTQGMNDAQLLQEAAYAQNNLSSLLKMMQSFQTKSRSEIDQLQSLVTEISQKYP
ncbi:hypothetical protein [Alicyclobacillus fodiniaquatilis]|uniref:Uncharacterized protein n=1 Tax=Alicyclobacillus fodiniaquatilis TaxID=1661150 RepID=A0ABW4JIF5_9BACL